MTPFLLSFLKNKMKIKKTSLHIGHLIVKAQQHQPKHWMQNILNKQSQVFQKCSMSKQEKEREKNIFI